VSYTADPMPRGGMPKQPVSPKQARVLSSSFVRIRTAFTHDAYLSQWCIWNQYLESLRRNSTAPESVVATSARFFISAASMLPKGVWLPSCLSHISDASGIQLRAKPPKPALVDVTIYATAN
jgi:hypothetical protein